MRTGNEIKVNIRLIRHGMTKSNEEHRYLGNREEKLSEQGIRNIRELLKCGYYSDFLPEKIDYVISSPMLRCKETKTRFMDYYSDIFSEANDIYIPDWREMNFGEFDGKNYKELNGNPIYQNFIDSGGKTAFPGGESQGQYIKRVCNAWDELKRSFLSENLNKSLEIICFVHGGTIMALMQEWTHGSYFDFQCKNGRGYYCEFLSSIPNKSLETGELVLKRWEVI